MNHCVQQSFLVVVKLCRLPRKLDENTKYLMNELNLNSQTRQLKSRFGDGRHHFLAGCHAARRVIFCWRVSSMFWTLLIAVGNTQPQAHRITFCDFIL